MQKFNKKLKFGGKNVLMQKTPKMKKFNNGKKNALKFRLKN